MKISILTLFPEMFDGPFTYSIVKNAKAKKLVDINFINIRDFGLGFHKTVDDTPYGGGHGMILKVDVIEKALKAAKNKKLGKFEEKIILTSASGKTFIQQTALCFSKLKHLIIICGHYEGIDERVKHFIDEEVSIGDFVLTGGEIPAMAITDAVTRLLKGVLKEGAAENESFSALLEYPQYTRPLEYNKQKVPTILLTGDHKKIDAWRKDESLRKTKKYRPDLLAKSIVEPLK